MDRMLQIAELSLKVKKNVKQVIVGNDEAIDLLLVSLLCQGNVLFEDVPGVGKTMLAKTFADSLGCSFKRIQATPDLMPTDVIGVNFYNQNDSKFEFSSGPIFSHVVLVDEINRATPRTQSALLEAMQEQQVTVDGVTMPLPRPFILMATQNPIEMEGTFPLPEAQLDRFMVRIKLGYPSQQEESEIFLRFGQESKVPDVNPVTNADEIINGQEIPIEVKFEDNVRRYLVDIISATRVHPDISLGASPRAGLALYRVAKAWAAINGRDFVAPDDVKELAPSVLSHRIIMNSTARLRGSTNEMLIGEILESTSVPIEK